MKRTVSLLLTLVIVIGLISSIPITSSAASISDLKFTLNSDGKSYSVESRNRSISGVLDIPSEFNGYPVTNIAEGGFDYCENITSITIPDTITNIGKYAFKYCENLTSISIPNGVTSIPDEAFFCCWDLNTIILPNSITSIGGKAFESCNSLASISFPRNLTSIANSAFKGCSKLTSISIPDSVTSIGTYAFAYCSNATYIKISNNLTTIDSAVFRDCESLTSIVIPNSITEIGFISFKNCSNLQSIVIPNNVTYIGQYAFEDCSNLLSATIGENVTLIDDGAFYGCDNLSSVVLYNNVENIESSAFGSCPNIKNTYYTGTLSEWNNIDISSGNDALFNNVIFNYDPLKPLAPKTTTTNEIGGVQVSWNKVDNATKYVVFRRQAGSNSWVNIGTTTGTTLLDKNVKSGVYYSYSVRAYGSTGKYSDFVQANTSTRKFMATPKLTTIYNHTNGLAIKWNAVSGVTKGYRVYRRGAGSTYWTYLGTTKNLYFIDNAVKNRSGEYFRYTVIADGGYHSKFDTTGLYLKRLANPTLTSAVSSSAGITVKWGAVSGTTGYYVYRKTANSSWVRIAAVGGTNNTTYLDKTARKGVTYTYTVRAVYGATTSAYNSGISCYDKY